MTASFGVLAGLAFAELAARILAPGDELSFAGSGYYLADPVLGIRLKPGFSEGNVHINSLGMRGPERSRTKAKGTWRILLLGDSFAFGAGNDPNTNFASLLDAKLADHRPRGELLNAGTPTWGTVQEGHYLESDGLDLNPDLVLLAVFVGNDITDDIDPPEYTAVSGFTVPREMGGSVSGLELNLLAELHHLRLWQLLRTRIGGRLSAQQIDPYWHEVIRHSERRADQRLDLHRVHPKDPESLELGWQHTFKAMDRLRRQCSLRKIPLMVIVIPDDLQLNPHWHLALKNAGMSLDEFDFGMATQRILDHCGDKGILALDLSPALAPLYRRGRRPYGLPGTKIDGHFNELGDWVATREIWYMLRTHSLLGNPTEVRTSNKPVPPRT